MPVIPAIWEAESGESLETGEAEIAVSQDYVIALQPGQQEQNSISKNKQTKQNKNIREGQEWWLRLGMPALWEANAGGSLEVRSLRSIWAK